MMQRQRAARLVIAAVVLALATVGVAQPSLLDSGEVRHWTPESVQAALDAGADVRARTQRGATPLMFAAGANENPTVAQMLLDAGADLGARDKRGGTPLIWAAMWNENPDVVRTLLDAGADGAAKDGRGRTAFDYASDNEALRGTDVYWRLNDARFR